MNKRILAIHNSISVISAIAEITATLEKLKLYPDSPGITELESPTDIDGFGLSFSCNIIRTPIQFFRDDECRHFYNLFLGRHQWLINKYGTDAVNELIPDDMDNIADDLISSIKSLFLKGDGLTIQLTRPMAGDGGWMTDQILQVIHDNFTVLSKNQCGHMIIINIEEKKAREETMKNTNKPIRDYTKDELNDLCTAGMLRMEIAKDFAQKLYTCEFAKRTHIHWAEPKATTSIVENGEIVQPAVLEYSQLIEGYIHYFRNDLSEKLYEAITDNRFVTEGSEIMNTIRTTIHLSEEFIGDHIRKWEYITRVWWRKDSRTEGTDDIAE